MEKQEKPKKRIMITIDDEVYHKVKKILKERNQKLSTVVNSNLKQIIRVYEEGNPKVTLEAIERDMVELKMLLKKKEEGESKK